MTQSILQLTQVIRLRRLLPAALIGVWLLVVLPLPLPPSLQWASWLAFIALLITPGYLLTEMITDRLNLDELEKLALALPIGLALLALPGTIALTAHWTLSQLVTAWIITAGIAIVVWAVWAFRGLDSAEKPRWQLDEILLLTLIVLALAAIFPTLTLYKIDGDAYAVGSFLVEALTDLPLNVTEPLFGTGLGPGARMVFNQHLTLNYLWVYLAGVDPIDFAAAGSKSMLAVWAILATYTLGKAAGNGSRRLGLFTAAIQLIIYLSAPFIRGDNVSLFFFERINADKFLVPTTMLPVLFALAIQHVRHGKWRSWVAAAVVAFAISTIHPLIAAMAALALGAFGGTHLLFNLRHKAAWQRTGALAGLVVVVMLLPMAQLVVARGEAPLAASYPRSFDGWSIDERLLTVFPFTEMATLDWVGPIPDMAELRPGDANADDNPFLTWRFALNMERRRLLIFDIDSYISDPSLIMEPVYVLALLLLPLLLPRLRRSVSTQFVTGITAAVLLVMFNPFITPIIGSLVMPWILWRFVWLFPYALIIALAGYVLLFLLARVFHWLRRDPTPLTDLTYAPLGLVLLLMLALMPAIRHNLVELHERVAFPYQYPTPERIFDRLQQEIDPQAPAMVLADQDLSVTLAAYVAQANILAHRVPTTSELFPADQQDVALARLLDQNSFFRTPYLTTASVEALRRYDVAYVAVDNGSPLDMQMRLAGQWFTWLTDDEGYALFAVEQVPPSDAAVIQGNSAMTGQRWEDAQRYFEQALADNPNDALALVGLAEVAHTQGRFAAALALLQQVSDASDMPILQYRLAQIYAELGETQASLTAFARAQAGIPQGSRFHMALGDACLRAGDTACAERQYEAAVGDDDYGDLAAQSVALAEIWRNRSDLTRAIPLYEEAVARRPSLYYRFLLATAYRDAGQIAQAERVIAEMRHADRFSAEPILLEADLRAQQGETEQAIDLYRQALWLQGWQMQDATDTYLGLARLWLDSGNLEQTQAALAEAQRLTPQLASAAMIAGDLAQQQGDTARALAAYEQAFALDPGQTATYLALSDQMRQAGSRPADVVPYLETAVRHQNRDATLLLALGDQMLRLGDTNAAIDTYRYALNQLNPYVADTGTRSQLPGAGRAFAYTRLAAAQEDIGALEPALNYYQAAAVTAPDAAWTHLLLGDALRRQNQPQAAEAAYRMALTKQPNYADAYARLADLLYAIGRNDEAEQIQLQAETVSSETTPDLAVTFLTTPAAPLSSAGSGETFAPLPWTQASAVTLWADSGSNVAITDAALAQHAIDRVSQEIADALAEGQVSTSLARRYLALGDLYLAQFDYETARLAYGEAVARDPWWPEARLSLAEALTWLDDEASALEHIRTAVELAPGSVEAQIALANALGRDGQPAEALAIYEATAAQHPGNGRATLALARAWQDRNRWDLAQQMYEKTLANNPGSADAYVGLAELAIDTAAYDDARTLLDSAMAIDRRNISIYVRLGELAQRLGDAPAALAWYQQAATLPTADQALNLTLIDSLLRYGDHDTAGEYALAALRQRPHDAELLLRLARIERVTGRYAEATASLAASREQDPDNFRVYLEEASLFLAQGEPDAAITAYEAAIARKPDEASTYIAASQLYVTQGGFTNALALLSSAVPEVERPEVIFAAMATLQMQQGEPEFALETLRHGLRELGDDNTGMLLALGDFFASRADFGQVELRYSQALAGQPDIAAVHIALGDLYLRQAEYDRAIISYNAAVGLDPATPSHYLSLANAYHVAGEWDSAESAYEQALTAAPTLVSGYRALAQLFIDQERSEDAVRVYERGLQAVPTSGQLWVAYARFELARGDAAQARQWLDQALAVAPTAATRIERAAMLLELGDAELAQTELEAAVVQEPGSVEAWVALGDLYRAEGDDAQAEAMYLRATDVMPGVPTGYLRLGQMAREREDRGEAVRYSDLAREAEPGGLVRPADDN